MRTTALQRSLPAAKRPDAFFRLGTRVYFQYVNDLPQWLRQMRSRIDGVEHAPAHGAIPDNDDPHLGLKRARR